ncbi:hypothetical protein GCM10010279_38930 [Streptomyces mutabilis]|nr:hypothetical protein GCM10010279_38930 [Streptomyces mutabilis]
MGQFGHVHGMTYVRGAGDTRATSEPTGLRDLTDPRDLTVLRSLRGKRGPRDPREEEEALLPPHSSA